LLNSSTATHPEQPDTGKQSLKNSTGGIMEYSAIGIDLGGTNLKGTIISKSGEGRHLTRIPTEAEKGGVQVMNNILLLIEQLIEKEGSSENILGVGIGTPGFVSEDGIVDGAENLPGWKGTSLYDPIMAKFNLKAVAANDATVAALAEARFGAGRGVRNMVLLTLGTGVGGGMVIDHKLFTGTHGMAGELGHIIVETDGIQCNCGLKGCAERYASATGVVYLAKKTSGEVPDGNDTPFSTLVKKDPDAITSKLVYDYVNKNDTVALSVHETVCDMLGRLIGIICNTLSPDRIVLGGGVMNAGQIIIDTVSRYAAKNCWPMIWEKCDVIAAELSEDAGVLGAGAMVFDAFDV
jgi:glucokinase